MYINPETVSGIAIFGQIMFAVIAGGMFVQLAPPVVFTLLLAEPFGSPSATTSTASMALSTA